MIHFSGAVYDDDPHDHIDGLSERVRSCQAGLAVVDEYVQGAGRVTRPLRDYILFTLIWEFHLIAHLT